MKFLLLIVCVMFGQMIIAQSSTLTVISHPKGSPQDLNENELKSIFLGERQRWKSGDKIVLALMKTNTPFGQYVCERMYEMTEDELKKYWLALVFQGRAEAPAFFNSIGELQAFVAEHPGAIGIIDQSSPLAGIQVVRIDGKKSL